MERKAGLRRQRKLSGALLSLSRSVQELTEENQSLKEDLDRVLSSSPTVARTKGTARASRALPPHRKARQGRHLPPGRPADVPGCNEHLLCPALAWGLETAVN